MDTSLWFVIAAGVFSFLSALTSLAGVKAHSPGRNRLAALLAVLAVLALVAFFGLEVAGNYRLERVS